MLYIEHCLFFLQEIARNNRPVRIWRIWVCEPAINISRRSCLNLQKWKFTQQREVIPKQNIHYYKYRYIWEMHNIFSRGCTVQVTYLLFRISNYLSVRMLSRYSRHIQNCLVRILVPGPGEFHLEKNVNEWVNICMYTEQELLMYWNLVVIFKLSSSSTFCNCSACRFSQFCCCFWSVSAFRPAQPQTLK